MPVMYSSGCDYLVASKMKNYHGFDKNAYSDFCIQNPIFMNKVKELVLHTSLNYEGKVLLLLSKIDAVDTMTRYLSNVEELDGKHICAYHSKIKKEDKENILDSSDIIIRSEERRVGKEC